MKRQYLGDSKDSFKWDYHDHLTRAASYNTLNILLMLTPDDGTGEGQTKPDFFPARKEIIDFCIGLRARRDLNAIRSLPEVTGADYAVNLHKPEHVFTKSNRATYFTGLTDDTRQIVFLDPDNGLEPERSCSEKHVKYADVFSILEQVSFDSVVSVFQHFRRVRFEEDFKRIRKRFSAGKIPVHTTAIFWHSLMFMLVSRSEDAIGRIRNVNQQYAQTYPVEVL